MLCIFIASNINIYLNDKVNEMLNQYVNIEIAISDNEIDKYCHFCIFCNFIAEGLRFYVDVNLISALTMAVRIGLPTLTMH